MVRRMLRSLKGGNFREVLGLERSGTAVESMAPTPGVYAGIRGFMVLALVRRARRRILHNEWLCEGANAASVALALVILLLVLGTQILNWYWVVLIPAVTCGIALYRVRQRTPSLYRTAQQVDRRMGLADSLSTALFFSDSTHNARVSSGLRHLQLTEAERIATGVDIRQAIPYRVPHTAYVAAALLLVASSVFALRYGLTDKLDLKQPLARILQQRLGLTDSDQQARLDPHKSDRVPFDKALAAEDGQQGAPEGDPNQPEDGAENPANPNPAAGKVDKDSKNSQSQMEPDSSNQDQADQAEDTGSDGKQNGLNSKDGQKNGKDSQSGSNAASDSQSLLSKMKEAMQNLLSSMQQNPQQQQQQNASNQNGKAGKGRQSQGKQQQAQKGDRKGAQTNEAPQQQPAGEGEQAQNSQGQSADKADSPLANKQPGSGAGNRDGSKDVKLAEQLAAMGKISEIIGKRSATVTGEATVDVQNTSQQLRTGYLERHAEHTQGGAEINRDEIPVALESYVQQYFEEVRKQAPPKK